MSRRELPDLPFHLPPITDPQAIAEIERIFTASLPPLSDDEIERRERKSA